MTTILTQPATVKVGRRSFPFTGLAEASKAYRATIEELGRGVSRTPPCRVIDGGGKVLAVIAYNGRAFAVGPDGETTEVLYEPAGDEMTTTPKKAKKAAPAKTKTKKVAKAAEPKVTKR